MTPVDRTAKTALGVAHAAANERTEQAHAAALPTRIANRYEVRGFIGAGGMGSVYRVHDLELDEEVALKFLKREVLGLPGVLDRFRAEVRLARRVTHENVARTFDIGEHGAERFLTMEYIAGESLTARLRREGVMAPGDAIALGLALAAGLGAAHRAGVVHRDLKPDNILLARNGRVVITDFGIARPSGTAPVAGAPQMVGSAGYMAPEQLQGAADLDGRADLYALGAVLFEVLTGRVAWPGNSFMAIAMPRLLEPPPDPRAVYPGVPDALAEIVLRLMAQRREERFASAEAVVQALTGAASALSHVPSTAVPPPLPVEARAARVAPMPAVNAPTIAVMPLRNVGPPEDDALASELTDEIIDGLSLTRGVQVRPRRALARAAGIDDLQELGRVVGAQVIVEGTVRRRDANIQLTARLIGVRDDIQLWSERYDVPAHEALRLAHDVVHATAHVLAGEAAQQDRNTLSISAVDILLKARRLLRERWMGFGDLEEVVHYFEQGLALAPDDLGMITGYAMAVARARNFASKRRAEGPDATRARSLVELALDDEPGRAEPWLALATLRSAESDWEGAVRALRRALHLSPGLELAQEMLASIEVEVACDEEGLARFSRIQHDPDESGAPLYRAALRHALYGHWEVFDRIIAAPVDEGSRALWDMLVARTNLYRRRVAHALPPLDPDSRDPDVVLTRLLDDTLRTGRLPASFETLRRTAAAAREGSRLRPFLFQVKAELLAFVGAHDEAMQAVADAVASLLLDVGWLDHCPLLDALRGRPEMKALRAEALRRGAPIREALHAPLSALAR